MIERTERELTPAEKRTLEQRAKRLEATRTRTMMGSMAAAAVISALLCVATLAASDAPRFVIIAFWTVLALVIGLWVGGENRRDFQRQVRALREGLNHNRARVLRVRSDRVAEFDEVEDEGACYAFQASDDEMVFVCGQQFYADSRFPNSDFSIVEVLASNGAIIDELLRKDGARLEPERRIPVEIKKSLEIPDHLEVVRGDITDLERILPRA